MASPSLVALTVFILWALLLIALMEIIRSKLVLQKSVAASGFRPDNAKRAALIRGQFTDTCGCDFRRRATFCIEGSQGSPRVLHGNCSD